MVAYAIGWGRDSIGAGLMIGILAPGAFLGATACSSILSASSIARKSKILAVGIFLFVAISAAICVFLFFSQFIPYVEKATGSKDGWLSHHGSEGHRLPAWWNGSSILIGVLSLAFMLLSIHLSRFSMKSKA